MGCNPNNILPCHVYFFIDGGYKSLISMSVIVECGIVLVARSANLSLIRSYQILVVYQYNFNVFYEFNVLTWTFWVISSRNGFEISGGRWVSNSGSICYYWDDRVDWHDCFENGVVFSMRICCFRERAYVKQ